MRRRAERVKICGGVAPYATRWVKNPDDERGRKWLEWIPGLVPVVLRVHEDFVAGMSMKLIAKGLIEREVPTGNGGEWRPRTDRNLLTQPLYVGKIRHDDELYQARQANGEPLEDIVPEALFEASQRRLKEVAALRGHGGGRSPKGAHLCTHGLLRCGRCGSAMIPRTNTRWRDGGQWYICDGRERRGKDFCSQRWVRREDIDEPLLAELSRRYVDREVMRSWLPSAKREPRYQPRYSSRGTRTRA